MTEDELRRRVAEKEHLVSSVLSGHKMWLVGDEDELAAIIGTVPAEPTRVAEPTSTRRLRELLRMHREEIFAVAQKRRVDNVRVFGSVARGDADATSDIDLLVDLAPHASLFDLSGFAGEVEALLGVRVDVVVERSIKCACWAGRGSRAPVMVRT